MYSRYNNAGTITVSQSHLLRQKNDSESCILEVYNICRVYISKKMHYKGLLLLRRKTPMLHNHKYLVCIHWLLRDTQILCCSASPLFHMAWFCLTSRGCAMVKVMAGRMLAGWLPPIMVEAMEVCKEIDSVQRRKGLNSTLRTWLMSMGGAV